MGFTTFVGRALFSAVFFFDAWIICTNGEMYLQAMEPNYRFLRDCVTSHGVPLPELQLKYLLWIAFVFEVVGGILFQCGSSLGACLLLTVVIGGSPLMYDFYNYDASSPEYAKQFFEILRNLSIAGTLLLFMGMKNDAAVKAKRKW
ncbi:hypothetical protein GOP47_0026334 [Adiantum capillus-veneris]|nr:hypothetical protein GOP47_0026334 [Adiantum capillus-veneris]